MSGRTRPSSKSRGSSTAAAAIARTKAVQPLVVAPSVARIVSTARFQDAHARARVDAAGTDQRRRRASRDGRIRDSKVEVGGDVELRGREREVTPLELLALLHRANAEVRHDGQVVRRSPRSCRAKGNETPLCCPISLREPW